MYVTSCTNSKHLPTKIIKRSRLRKFFLLPWVIVEYEGTNLKGNCTYVNWMRPSDIGGYSDNT